MTKSNSNDFFFSGNNPISPVMDSNQLSEKSPMAESRFTRNFSVRNIRENVLNFEKLITAHSSMEPINRNELMTNGTN